LKEDKESEKTELVCWKDFIKWFISYMSIDKHRNTI
jgi:hypothetical protein